MSEQKEAKRSLASTASFDVASPARTACSQAVEAVHGPCEHLRVPGELCDATAEDRRWPKLNSSSTAKMPGMQGRGANSARQCERHGAGLDGKLA